MNQLEVTPFTDADLEGFVPQAGQRPELPAGWSDLLKYAGRLGPTGSFKYGGQTVAVVGLLTDEWGGQAWALLDARAGLCLLALTRALRWFLDHFKERERPITVYLRTGWPKAAQWARLLGFHPLNGGLEGAFALWVYNNDKGDR